MLSKTSGVTNRNHREKFAAWCEVNGIGKTDEGLVTLRRANRADDGKWNAWRNWRKSKGISCAYMDQQYRSWQGVFTVPTAWPRDYDDDWSGLKDLDFHDLRDPPPSDKRTAEEQQRAEDVVAEYRAKGLLAYDPKKNSLQRAIKDTHARKPPASHFELDDDDDGFGL